MSAIDEQLNELTEFMPIEKLRQRISSATAWVGREPDAAVASTVIGADGIALASLYLTAGDLLVEVSLTSLYDNFDVMKLAVFNARVTLGVQEVKVGEQVVASYHTAIVTLQHSSSPGLTSVISYAGAEPPTKWLATVKAAFPIELLQRTV